MARTSTQRAGEGEDINFDANAASAIWYDLGAKPDKLNVEFDAHAVQVAPAEMSSNASVPPDAEFDAMTAGKATSTSNQEEPARNATADPTVAVARSNDQRIDGLLGGVRWSDGNISYSTPDAAGDYQSGYFSDQDRDGISAQNEGFSQFSGQQTNSLHFALNADILGQPAGASGFAVEGFTNLTISFAGPGTGAATMRYANTSDAATAYNFFPSTAVTGGDGWFGPNTRTPDEGNYSWMTSLHEVGHGLGLKHGQETGVFGALPANVDSHEFSLMTYRSYIGSDAQFVYNEAFGYPQTYMMLDIAALQYMYGADFTSNAGNTVYTWNPNTGESLINGVVAISPGGNRIFSTIWDGNGVDTYDLSNYTTSLDINLTPGGWSDFSVGSNAQNAFLGGGPNGGYARGHVFNALLFNFDPRSLIENAIGGSNSDTFTGNTADNTLRGRGGDDTMDGGFGTDSAVFAGLRSAYTLISLGGDRVRVAGPDGVDTLTSIERLVFDDQVVIWVPTPAAKVEPYDFNGDGRNDILWQHANGTPAVWLLNGTNLLSYGPPIVNAGAAWHENAAGDFNGDGKADILFQNDNGTPAVWLMNGTTPASFGPQLANPGPSWHEKAAADFNGDGKADILWQNDNGAAAVWLMNGVNVASFGPALPNPGPSWHANEAADFNGDGKADILWQNDDGTPAVWLMNGTSPASFGAGIVNPGPAWHERAAADFNGDG